MQFFFNYVISIDIPHSRLYKVILQLDPTCTFLIMSVCNIYSCHMTYKVYMLCANYLKTNITRDFSEAINVLESTLREHNYYTCIFSGDFNTGFVKDNVQCIYDQESYIGGIY